MRECFYAAWYRPKVKQTDYLCLVPQWNDYTSCVYHSIACHAAMLVSPSENVFGSYSSCSSGASIINQELKRIESIYYSEGVDRKRKFTKGLTSHSVRSGATNALNRSKQVKSEWIDLRCGRSLKSHKDSKYAYIHREWETDYPCARST